MGFLAKGKLCMVLLWEWVTHRNPISPGNLCSLSFSMEVIWDNNAVWKNYENMLPILIPYQLLLYSCFFSLWQ